MDCLGGKFTFCEAPWKIASLPVISAQVSKSVVTDGLIRLLCVLSLLAVVPFKRPTMGRVRTTEPLELAFDTLLCNTSLHEDILAGFRVSGINDRELFVTIDDNLADLKSWCRDAFGVDSSSGGVLHKVEL